MSRSKVIVTDLEALKSHESGRFTKSVVKILPNIQLIRRALAAGYSIPGVKISDPEFAEEGK